MSSRLVAALGASLLLALGFSVAPAVLAPASALTGVSESAGTVTITFTFAASGEDRDAQFTTVPGTAQSDVDFAAIGPVLFTIPAGDTSASVPVSIIDDSIDEATESFIVSLNSTFGSIDETVEIADDDPAPTLSINDVTHFEGAAGDTTDYTFTATLSSPSAFTVTVDYATAGDSAAAGDDFNTISGTLTFLPGVTTQTFTVGVVGDSTFEGSEQFFANLSNPANATIADGQGVGTITDDDASNIPSLTITPESRTVTEGPDGTSTVYTYEVYRLGPSGLDATFDIIPTGFGATEGVDWDFVTPGPYTIPAGAGGGNVLFDIVVYGDDVYEGTERFDLTIDNTVNASRGEVGTAHVTITDDDPRPAELSLTGSNPTGGLLGGVFAVLMGVALIAFANLRRRYSTR